MTKLLPTKFIINGIGLLFLSMSAVLASCAGNKTIEVASEDINQIFSVEDSCEHLSLSISLELPTGKDSASLQICDSLIAEFIRSINHSGVSDESSEQIPPYKYNHDDIQALVDYYERAAYDRLLKMAMEDFNERMAYLEEDTTMTNEEREQIKKDIPQWAFDFAIKKTIDTSDFVVYNAQSYCYYGGAHGGVGGTGAITFNKTTGTKIDKFIKDDATISLQPLIRKGLIQYYRESGDTINDAELSERLQIEGHIIPLPQAAPYFNATADSLFFTYGQYEIACYADGMPSFAIPVKAISTYLTPEAKALIKK